LYVVCLGEHEKAGQAHAHLKNGDAERLWVVRDAHPIAQSATAGSFVWFGEWLY
jgi:trehalose utilization protein